MGDNITRDWLEEFYGDTLSADSRCALWISKGKKHTWCKSVDEAAAGAAKTADQDTYFSMGLFPKGVTRRKKDLVTTIFGVWLDIDAGDKRNGQDYFPTIAKAIEWVYDALAGKWTHIVHSGGGLHVYLMFDEPFEIETDADRIAAERVVKAYHRWADSQCPHTIDSLIDLSRIMRLPGTRNTKAGELCHLIDTCNTSTSVSDLLDTLPHVVVSESGQVAGVDGDADLNTVKDRIAIMCSVDPTFSDTWKRKRRFRDNSPSGYCLSLANQLCESGLNDAEVQAALQMWRSGQADAKEKPTEWYQSTIAKARESTSGKAFDKRLATVVLETDSEERQKLVAEVFGMPLLSFVKLQTPEYKGHSEKVSYTMQFEHGTLKIPSTAALLQQRTLRELMFENLGVVLKSMKGPQFDGVITLLLDVMEVQEIDPEGNLAFEIEGALRTYVGAKIEQCEVVRDMAMYENHQLFEDDDGTQYYCWNSFKIRLSNMNLYPNNKELGKLLRGLGSEPKQFTDAKRSRLWSVPDGL